MNFQVSADFNWLSDWNGYEVNYPDVSVVGLYALKKNPDVHCYIDMETLEILELWYICEECEASF